MRYFWSQRSKESKNSVLKSYKAKSSKTKNFRRLFSKNVPIYLICRAHDFLSTNRKRLFEEKQRS